MIVEGEVVDLFFGGDVIGGVGESVDIVCDVGLFVGDGGDCYLFRVDFFIFLLVLDFVCLVFVMSEVLLYFVIE